MLYLLLRKGQMGFNGNNAEEGLAKSHIRQYVRMDGTVVQEHQDRRVAKHPDILAHEDTHGDRIYAGSKLEHGPELATQLEASGQASQSGRLRVHSVAPRSIMPWV